MESSVGILMILAVAFGIVLIIAWIVLPFAIIGTKPLLKELLAEAIRTNELLAARAPKADITAEEIPPPSAAAVALGHALGKTAKKLLP